MKTVQFLQGIQHIERVLYLGCILLSHYLWDDLVVHEGVHQETSEFIQEASFAVVSVQDAHHKGLDLLTVFVDHVHKLLGFHHGFRHLVLLVFLDSRCKASCLLVQIFDHFVLLVEVVELRRVAKFDLVQVVHHREVEL